ncbi:GNAT family N-acetyltransferase [Pseudokineococcus sp. 1T1Z-3]|uniref:GNAT family N-acetyltransferase n=1 Tax=Pseudokineococcus sp. 1T1Z-3 TaxID=3132745 RepID=UPI0030B392D9
MELRSGDVTLRPIHRRDRAAWGRLRAANAAWLAPWEATPPAGTLPPPSFPAMVRELRQQARLGQSMPFVVEHRRRMAGQLTVAGMSWGSLRSGTIGYWVDQRLAGRGITPTAVAMTTDHCFGPVGLHRVEINIRPENVASLRVVEKLGFRDEGLRRGYLHIDGAWRDHRTFALTAEEAPDGLLARWLAARGDAPAPS